MNKIFYEESSKSSNEIQLQDKIKSKSEFLQILKQKIVKRFKEMLEEPEVNNFVIHDGLDI